MNKDRLIYKSHARDNEANLPVFVFDSTFIPPEILSNTCDEEDVQQFTENLWAKLPADEDYCLVLFTTAFSKYDFSSKARLRFPLTFVRFFQLIPVEKKERLLKLYIVHENWVVRSFVELFRTLWNFGQKIVHCENLSRLADYLDITQIPVSLMTYAVDHNVYKNPSVTLSHELAPVFGSPLRRGRSNEAALRQFSRIYNNLMAYLKTPNLNFELTRGEWQMVMRINYLDKETKMTVAILSGCIKRDQSVYLSDFSFLEHYIILMKFVYKLSESLDPIIPQEALLGTAVNYDDVGQLNTLFNDILIYQHPERDTTSQAAQNGQYDNAYVIIKLFKFFHALLEKLDHEVHTFEDYEQQPERVRRRQVLRLILAFTKVLYDDNPELDDPDEVGFDNLFKFVYAVMRHYSAIRVLGTESGMEEFNNYITVADFDAFEAFKLKVLTALQKRDEDEEMKKRAQEHTAKVVSEETEEVVREEPAKAVSEEVVSKEPEEAVNEEAVSEEVTSLSEGTSDTSTKATSVLSVEKRPSVPESPTLTESPTMTESSSVLQSPTVHESPIIESPSVHESPVTPQSSSVHEIPVTPRSPSVHEISLSWNTLRGLLRSTPTAPADEKENDTPTPRRWENKLVKPSEKLTSRLIKYTEKDLIVQKEHPQDKTPIAPLTPKQLQSRKVSQLARLYEEKLFGD